MKSNYNKIPFLLKEFLDGLPWADPCIFTEAKLPAAKPTGPVDEVPPSRRICIQPPGSPIAIDYHPAMNAVKVIARSAFPQRPCGYQPRTKTPSLLARFLSLLSFKFFAVPSLAKASVCFCAHETKKLVMAS